METYEEAGYHRIFVGQRFYHLRLPGVTLINSKRNGIAEGWIESSATHDGPFTVLLEVSE